MLRNFSAPILDLNDVPMKVGVSPEAQAFLECIWAALLKLSPNQAEILQKDIDALTGKTVTLGLACSVALMSPLDGDKPLSPVESSDRLALALKVGRGGDVDVTTDEIVLFKERVAKRYGTLIGGRAYDLLEAP